MENIRSLVSWSLRVAIFITGLFAAILYTLVSLNIGDKLILRMTNLVNVTEYDRDLIVLQSVLVAFCTTFALSVFWLILIRKKG